jgi:hypothetical protein
LRAVGLPCDAVARLPRRQRSRRPLFSCARTHLQAPAPVPVPVSALALALALVPGRRPLPLLLLLL